MESIGEIRDVEEGKEERVGELAETINHVMNITNEQSKSNMILENLDVLKDCRQFTIFPDALELKKQRSSSYKILKQEENKQKEDDKAYIGEISDEKEYSKRGAGQMRYPGTDKVNIGRFRASVILGPHKQAIAAFANYEKEMIKRSVTCSNCVTDELQNRKKSILKSIKEGQEKKEEDKAYPPKKSEKLHVFFNSKGMSVEMNLCICIYSPLAMVKTFRERSESSSSYESVEDLEFKQMKGEQAEVEYLHVLII